MLRMLADENFSGDILRGLLLRRPHFDLVRVQDVGLGSADDPSILGWAAQGNRILLTHDRATMPSHAFARMAAGHSMPGVFVVNDRYPIGSSIDEILLLAECSDHEEWSGRVVFLPL